jgi:ABC-type sugar transport system ATPase subunit
MEKVLRAQGVEKAYGRRVVLRGVDLEVGAGSLVAVVGENGAGKSTLLKILAGTLGADAGAVELHGTLGYLWGAKISVLPQTGDSRGAHRIFWRHSGKG